MLHFFDLSPVHLPHRSHGADDCFYCSWRDVPRTGRSLPQTAARYGRTIYGDAIVASPTLEPNGLLVMTIHRSIERHNSSVLPFATPYAGIVYHNTCRDGDPAIKRRGQALAAV